MKNKATTVGDLREQLKYMLTLPDNTEITFGSGDLSLSKINATDHTDIRKTLPTRLQFEFAELYKVTFDPLSEA